MVAVIRSLSRFLIPVWQDHRCASSLSKQMVWIESLVVQITYPMARSAVSSCKIYLLPLRYIKMGCSQSSPVLKKVAAREQALRDRLL